MALIYFDSNSFFFFVLFLSFIETNRWMFCLNSDRILMGIAANISLIHSVFFLFCFLNSLLIVACRRKRWLTVPDFGHYASTYVDYFRHIYCFFCCYYTKSQGTIVDVIKCIRLRNNFLFHCLWTTTTDGITWEAQPRGFAMYALQLDDVRLDEKNKTKQNKTTKKKS